MFGILLLTVCAVGILWLCVGWPIAAAIARRTHRRRLREMLGEDFRQTNSYVCWSSAIGINEADGSIAICDRGLWAKITVAELREVSLAPGALIMTGGQSFRLDTLNANLPSLMFETLWHSPSLVRLSARLKAIMVSQPQRPEAPGEIAQSMLALTIAITELSSAIREMAGSSRPLDQIQK